MRASGAPLAAPRRALKLSWRAIGTTRVAAAATALPPADDSRSTSHRAIVLPTTSLPRHVAVIGGGFAGLAAAWHLLAAARAAGTPLDLTLIDAHGLGSGGSGAAAGLLHPYTPRGKVLWRGAEAFQDAVALLDAAEAAVEEAGAAAAEAARVRRPFAWRHGLLRPARSAKQARDITRFLPADAAAAEATGAEAVARASELAALVPGLCPEQLLPAAEPSQANTAPTRRGQRQQQRQHASMDAAAGPAAGLLVRRGATVHPASYLRALWLACQRLAESGAPGSAARLELRAVPSLRRLRRGTAGGGGRFDVVVVAAGAAAGAIEELHGVLPMELCHGHSLDLQPGDSSSGGSSSGGGAGGAGSSGGSGYPAGAPSLLGSPYIAAHGPRSVVVGATRRYGLTAAEALEQCGSPVVRDADEAAAAAAALLPGGAALWPPLAGWRVAGVRAGVRGLPTRGADGAIPYAGQLLLRRAATHAELGQQQQWEPPADCWLIGGLGARGLVYHAWLGRLVAAGVAAGTDAALPPELRRWQQAEGEVG